MTDVINYLNQYQAQQPNMLDSYDDTQGMPRQRPADTLRWLANALGQNKDLPAPQFFMDPRALSVRNMLHSSLGTAANWLDGTKDPSLVGPAEMVSPLGLAPMGSIGRAATSAAKAAPIAAKAIEDVPSHGLDMSHAARMARAKEMGFDTENLLYHGATTQIDEFQPRPFGGSGPGVVWLTPSARHADWYNNTRFDANIPPQSGGSTIPLYANPGRQLVVDAKGEGPFSLGAAHYGDAIGQRVSQARDTLAASLEKTDPEYATIIRGLKDPKDVDEWINRAEYLGSDAARYVEGDELKSALAYHRGQAAAPAELKALWDALNGPDATTPELFRRAKEDGYDSIRFNGMRDVGGRQDQVVVFDPSRLRSPQAAFNPADAGKGGLLLADNAKGSAPGTVVNSTQQQDGGGIGDFLYRNFVDATVPLTSDENEWAQEMLGQRELRRNDARYQGRVVAKSITDGLESVGRGLSSINDYTPGALLKKAAEKYGTGGPIEPVNTPSNSTQQQDSPVMDIIRRYGLPE